MIPVIIGLPSGASRQPYHDEIQTWLGARGMGVYYPQCAHVSGYNLAQQWDAEKEYLDWSPATVAEVQAIENPMVGYYPRYFWGDRVRQTDGRINPNPNAYAFAGISQDKLNADDLTYYLRRVRGWLVTRGIANPWYMIDEPAHPVDGDASKYGWSPTMEARVIKFVTCAQAAGWAVGVAYPNPQAHKHWRTLLPAHSTILAAKHSAAEYGEIPADVWLYNRQPTFDGLAEQMAEFGAAGYLHWSAEWDKAPLVKNTVDGWEPTELFDQLVHELARYEAMQEDPPLGDASIMQLFFTNTAAHHAAANGLQAIPGWAEQAVIQIEFATTETDSSGARFALAGAPGAWLGSEGVDVWYYVDPVAPVLLATQTAIVNEGNPKSDPFWFRKRQANAILGNGWLLMDAAGNPVIGGGRRRAVPDIGNFAYIEWLAAEVIKAGVKRVFLDNFNPHQHAFHRPQRAAGQDGKDTRYLAGMMLLCQRLRAAGIVIMANAAWEMSDPDEAPDDWTYPLMPYVDAVCIELEHKPTEGKANTGFARWSDGKFWALSMVDLSTMIEHWQDADADVLLAVTWRGGPGDYETFANTWHEDATMGDYWLFTGIEPGATHRVDRYMLPTPEPEPPPDVGAELQHIRLDIAAATALLGKAMARLQALEASA